MTRPRYDNRDTPFSAWVRNKPGLDNGLKGYTFTDIDYVPYIWNNYKIDKWMFLEEKTRHAKMRFWQIKVFERVDSLCKEDDNYYGFHVLVFENTNPSDGKTWLDNKLITVVDLLRFLRFELDSAFYSDRYWIDKSTQEDDEQIPLF